MLSSRERRLLAMPSDAYLLQLLGARSEKGARDFVRRYGERLPLTYYETELSNKAWYVVVTGPYASKIKAQAAIKQLPSGLQKQKPWARPVVDVQQQIRAHKNPQG